MDQGVASVSVRQTKWLGRSLANYLAMHTQTAKNKGVLAEFLACKTLTKARKVLFGEKPKAAYERSKKDFEARRGRR